ncbi:MAG: hypothetical protein LBI42_11085 [Chitinispirillales bacterium]|jgi:hypothetical protein|nr:hypothetical protein [Chitinispirillales bacterium]
MNIKNIAEKINEKASSYRMGNFQDIRAETRESRKYTSKIFAKKSIFEKDGYAYHCGGRTEIQYNIGFEINNLLRYGLAFSLERSHTLPNVSDLYPQIFRLNYLIREHSNLLSGYKMIVYAHNKGRDESFVHEIQSSLIHDYKFIFLGKMMAIPNIDYDKILLTFDDMLSIYRYVVTDTTHKLTNVKHSSQSNQFKFEKTSVKLPSKRSYDYTREQICIDIDVRHSIIQEKLVNVLINEYGNDNVSLEHPLFGNRKVDVVVNDNKKIYFYEVKTAPAARYCIREAMGQILEYGFWHGKKHADKLFIVGTEKLDKDTRLYLDYINNEFNIPLEYFKVDI